MNISGISDTILEKKMQGLHGPYLANQICRAAALDLRMIPGRKFDREAMPVNSTKTITQWFTQDATVNLQNPGWLITRAGNRGSQFKFAAIAHFPIGDGGDSLFGVALEKRLCVAPLVRLRFNLNALFNPFENIACRDAKAHCDS